VQPHEKYDVWVAYGTIMLSLAHQQCGTNIALNQPFVVCMFYFGY